MIKFIKKELYIEKFFKKRITIICDFYNTKPTVINKNNFTISSEDIDKIKNYIEQTNDNNSSLGDANSIDVILKKYENDMREHSNEVRNLKKNTNKR